MQSALSHAAAAAPAQAQCGRPTPRRPARLASRLTCSAVQTAAAPEAATGAVKLPATHLASSAAALQQLKVTSVNRERDWAARGGLGWLECGPWNPPTCCSGLWQPRALGPAAPWPPAGPPVQHWGGGAGQLVPAAVPPAAGGSVQPAPTRPPRLLPAAGYAMEKKSSIIAIGLTVHNAPVELREKLAVPEAEWQRAIEELCSYPHIEEAAVLSTCNRMEIYVVAVSFHRGAHWGEVEQRAARSCRAAAVGVLVPPGRPAAQHGCSVPVFLPADARPLPCFFPFSPGVREVEDWMSRASGVGLEELRPHLFLLRDRDATGHLLRVAGASRAVECRAAAMDACCG